MQPSYQILSQLPILCLLSQSQPELPRSTSIFSYRTLVDSIYSLQLLICNGRHVHDMQPSYQILSQLPILCLLSQSQPELPRSTSIFSYRTLVDSIYSLQLLICNGRHVHDMQPSYQILSQLPILCLLSQSQPELTRSTSISATLVDSIYSLYMLQLLICNGRHVHDVQHVMYPESKVLLLHMDGIQWTFTGPSM